MAVKYMPLSGHNLLFFNDLTKSQHVERELLCGFLRRQHEPPSQPPPHCRTGEDLLAATFNIVFEEFASLVGDLTWRHSPTAMYSVRFSAVTARSGLLPSVS